MVINHKYSKKPYEIDLEELINNRETNKIAALTKKNSAFIEAVVRIDSNYKKDTGVVPPDDGFDVSQNSNDSKGKYCGSFKYWFNKMQEQGADYGKCMLGAVISIDRGNKTHLEQVMNGRILMRDRIVSFCPNVKSLREALETPFDGENGNHLIAKMTESGLKAIKDNKDRFFISFASKFCAYAAIALKTRTQYSKYDKVVSDYLYLYSNCYCGTDYKKMHFKIKEDPIDFERKRKQGLLIYRDYQNVIDEIIKARQKTIKLSKTEFDHIVWYCGKGQ